MLLLPITIVGHSGNDGLKLGRRELDAGACRCGKTLRRAAPSQDHARRQALAGRTGIATPPRSSTGASAALLGGSGERDGHQGGTAGRLWTRRRPLWIPVLRATNGAATPAAIRAPAEVPGRRHLGRRRPASRRRAGPAPALAATCAPPAP